jgi:glucosamine--fructose-6-phosphate aminotransferase (isomerizing)
MKELAQRLDGLKAESLSITDQSNKQAATPTALVVPAKLGYSGPLPADVYTPIPYIIPAQLFAALLAEVKGINPDEPRGLSKVTLTM